MQLPASGEYRLGEVGLNRTEPVFVRLSIIEGSYEARLTRIGLDADPYLTAQFIPNGQTCSDLRWNSNDDDSLNSLIEVEASSSGELLVSLTELSFDESAPAEFSLVRSSVEESEEINDTMSGFSAAHDRSSAGSELSELVDVPAEIPAVMVHR